MFLLHWKREGEIIHQGFSFYHPKDTHSAGVCLRIGNRLWRLRYSKFSKKWNWGYHKVDPHALELWEAHHGYNHNDTGRK